MSRLPNFQTGRGPARPPSLAAPGIPQVRPEQRSVRCCNGEANNSSISSLMANRFKAQVAQVGDLPSRSLWGSDAGFVAAPATHNVAAPAASTSFRPLSPLQQDAAKRVFVESLDFSTIFISDSSGLGGRPFTLTLEMSGTYCQILNCGTFWPTDSVLIHELAHAWQSQHHSHKLKYMVNALSSQKDALEANLLAVLNEDVTLAWHTNYPMFYPYDAYAYHPSQTFNTMAAEQMASAVENEEPHVLTFIQSAVQNVVDPYCIFALEYPRYGDHRLPGVKG